MSAPDRPLPESLTRLLTGPATREFAPTPGDRRGRRPPGPAPQKSDGALEAMVLRGFVLLVSSLVWGAILWCLARHLLR